MREKKKIICHGLVLPLLSSTVPPSVFLERDLVLVTAGDTVSLQCSANGRPPAATEWYKGRELLEPTRRIALSSSGLLVINAADQNDAGFYTCLAKNPVGSDSATVTVNVQSE